MEAYAYKICDFNHNQKLRERVLKYLPMSHLYIDQAINEWHKDVVEKLKAAGHLYESFLTGEEIDARNEAAGRSKHLGYDNSERELDQATKDKYLAEGRSPALRLRVPEGDISFVDLVLQPCLYIRNKHIIVDILLTPTKI